MALDEPDLSPRELATRFTDTKSYFVSESSVYRLLKAHDLIASPAFIVVKAGDEFKDKTTAPNQLCQTDFTFLKVVGWDWFYLSTILDNFSRYIIASRRIFTERFDDGTLAVGAANGAARVCRPPPWPCFGWPARGEFRPPTYAAREQRYVASGRAKARVSALRRSECYRYRRLGMAAQSALWNNHL